MSEFQTLTEDEQQSCDLNVLFQVDPLGLSERGLERIVAEMRAMAQRLAAGGTVEKGGKTKLTGGLDLKALGLKK